MTLIENFHGAPGVPMIVQSGRRLNVGEVLFMVVGGRLQPFSVLRIATCDEWAAAIRALGFHDKPDKRAVCFAEVVTD